MTHGQSEKAGGRQGSAKRQPRPWAAGCASPTPRPPVQKCNHHQRSHVASKGRDLKTPLDYRSAARPTLGYANKGSVFAVTKRLGPPDPACVNLPSPHARARSPRPQSRRARRRSSAASRPAAAGAAMRRCGGARASSRPRTSSSDDSARPCAYPFCRPGG